MDKGAYFCKVISYLIWMQPGRPALLPHLVCGAFWVLAVDLLAGFLPAGGIAQRDQPSSCRYTMESDLMFVSCRKATGVLKIIHERYSKNVAEFNAYMVEFTEAIQHNDQIQPHLSKVSTPPRMSMQLLMSKQNRLTKVHERDLQLLMQ